MNQTSTLGLADSVGRDLRYSFRSLLRRPTFTLSAVLSLALGVVLAGFGRTGARFALQKQNEVTA